jgi:hypothetical protein
MITATNARRIAVLTLLVAATTASSILAKQKQDHEREKSAREVLVEQAQRLRPFVRSEIAESFLLAVPELPAVAVPRVAYHNRETRDAVSVQQADTMSEEELAGYERLELDEEFYYFTRYGTPLAFVRPLDLLGRAGLESLDGARVVDFGFGSIGQLRLMASCGANAHGIDVDRLLGVLYGRRGDTGLVPRAKSAGFGHDGRVTVHIGRWPADTAMVRAVGGGYTAFISKNTLKNGYIHPAQEVDPRMLVHLGVGDEEYVRAVYRALQDRGYFMIYNLCPAQSKERYIPWADGRCPFERDLLERVGFQVLAYNEDDTQAAREMGKLLGWGDQMDLEHDLFGTYTLMRK